MYISIVIFNYNVFPSSFPGDVGEIILVKFVVCKVDHQLVTTRIDQGENGECSAVRWEI